jgi:hypothetical protein
MMMMQQLALAVLLLLCPSAFAKGDNSTGTELQLRGYTLNTDVTSKLKVASGDFIANTN